MKLIEITNITQSTEQLNEIDVKRAIAGGAFALGTMLSPSPTHHSPAPPHVATQPSVEQRDQVDTAVLANAILKKYRVSPRLAMKVAKLAREYEKPSFPKAEDILAIIGIESSFTPMSVSKLRTDPAVGLMQVRPGVWKLDRNELLNDIGLQIKTGADILHRYYKLLGNADDAVHAYNVGIGNFRRGKHNPGYVSKYKNELTLYKS